MTLFIYLTPDSLDFVKYILYPSINVKADFSKTFVSSVNNFFNFISKYSAYSKCEFSRQQNQKI